MRRKLSGSGSGRDEVVLEEPDASRFLALGRTKDGAFVTLNSNSRTSSEVHSYIFLSSSKHLSCIVTFTVYHPQMRPGQNGQGVILHCS